MRWTMAADHPEMSDLYNLDVAESLSEEILDIRKASGRSLSAFL